MYIIYINIHILTRVRDIVIWNNLLHVKYNCMLLYRNAYCINLLTYEFIYIPKNKYMCINI